MITWKESYSTDIPELDKQHKALFDCANELEKTIEDNALSQRIVDGTLAYLKTYIKVHFGQEEACMNRHNCPIAHKNKEAHQQFIQKFKSMEERIKKDENYVSLVKELHHFLETWLAEHIGKIDSRLKPCVVPM